MRSEKSGRLCPGLQPFAPGRPEGPGADSGRKSAVFWTRRREKIWDIQVQAIAQCQKRLERNLLAAEQEVNSRGRIARAAGFSAGIALALLVI